MLAFCIISVIITVCMCVCMYVCVCACVCVCMCFWVHACVCMKLESREMTVKNVQLLLRQYNDELKQTFLPQTNCRPLIKGSELHVRSLHYDTVILLCLL